MSWSVYFAGKPEDVIKNLEAESLTLDGDSKKEYEEALPHLIGLVKQNIGHGGQIKIDALGHAYFENGEKKYGECWVTIKEHDPLI